MKRHALFVGVDQYTDGHIPNLSCAVSDAMDLHGFFKYGAGYDRVELLQNPAGKKEVLGKVRELTGDLGSGDFFLLFFAGHGFRVGENHVLVCANDLYEDVKYEDDGLPLGQLKRRLVGPFDSALLLDACQSDILATRGGEGIAERDLSLIHEAPTDRTCGGALTIVTSCDAGQTAAELSEARHGLFTLAMLDLLKEAQGAHARLDLSDSFKMSLGRRMREIAARSGLSTDQRPRFSSPGETCFVLLDGISQSSGMHQLSETSPTDEQCRGERILFLCPVCGRNNHTENTFNCVVCGREHLCMSHFSEEYKCCTDCAEKKSNLKRAKEALSAKDYDLLWECLRNADLNDPEGMYLQAQLYKNGCARLEQAPVMAFEWFYKASESGYVNAKAELGHCYYYGRGVRQSREKAFECYKIAAEHANVDAQYNLSVCYREGAGIAANDDEAVKWCRKAAEHGQTEAQFALGMRYLIGDGVLQNYIEALKWYRKAAEQGYAKGQHALAGFYENGTGVAQSHEEAVKLYRMAAEQGHADACVKLSECYRSGRGVAQDNDESEKWYGKACELRHEAGMRAFEETESYYKEGMAYLEGNGVTKDESHGFQCLDIAADRGHVKVMKEVAECYYHGRGVKKNYAESVRLYEIAAKMGSEEAKKKLLQIQAQVSCAAPCREPSSIQHSSGVEIQVGNLNYDMTEDQLCKLLGQYGEVGSVRIVTNRFTGKSKGYGFVSMPNRSDAANAIAALNGMDVQGHSISLREVGDA